MKEKIFVEINGIKQGMFLHSENIENPVLLFLHGGPGSPEYLFCEKFPTGFEKMFTVCWWEQRGSGLSFHHKISAKEMTVKQMILDMIAVTNYLRERFQKEKIYLMGHSWGTLLGVLAIKQEPSLFCAYIGIGQVANQDKSERLAYSYMLSEFSRLGNKKMLKQLEKFPLDKGAEISLLYTSTARSKGMMKLRIGIMREWTSMGETVKILLSAKCYSLAEKLKFIIGSGFSLKHLWHLVTDIDLFCVAPELSIPVYVFHGKYDYQVSYAIAKEYVQTLKAPLKGFYTFENSAHSPCFEESEKMCHILRTDVLQRKVDLSDNL